MPLPNAKMKINKEGVIFESNVDASQYLITELARAALRDSAKLIRKRVIEKLKGLPGMKRNKRLYQSSQYWVRRKETDLQIGFKHNTWYGVLQELGDRGQPKRDILRSTVMENIDELQRIQAQYLSALNDTNPSDPGDDEYQSGEGDE